MGRGVLTMRGGNNGFTLVEVVIALAIMAVSLIATAPMFVYAARENAGGGDRGMVGVLAVERMEQLRGQYFYVLNNGGSLDSNVSGYSDSSNPDFDVRWVISDKSGAPAGLKVIVVRALANRAVFGQPKQVTMATTRGE